MAFSSDEVTEHTVGKLDEEVCPSKEIIWKIPKFFELPEKINYWVCSPTFSLANAEWCLQMFPNGQKEENTNGWIDLLLMRLHAHDSNHLVWYTLGIKTCHGTNYESFHSFNTFKGSYVEWGVAHLLKRSRTLDDEELIAKDGIVTVFCEMQVAEKPPSVCSKLPKSFTNCSMFKMPEQLKVGDLSGEFFSTKDILWKIPDAVAFLEERGNQIDSPTFNFENATWCLQMYLINETVEENDACFGLKLLRLHSNILKHKINCTLGIKNCFGKMYNSFNRQCNFRKKAIKLPKFPLLTRSVAQTCTITVPKGCVTAYCRMYTKKIDENLIPEKQSPESTLNCEPPEITKLQLCCRPSFSREYMWKITKFFHFSLDEECQSVEITRQQLYCGPALSREFTWKITKFFDLPTDEGYFIDSAEFFLANATWCLRVYPNGQKGDSSGGIHLLLVRLYSCNSEHQMHYNLGLKTRHNHKHGNLTHMVSFHANAVEMGIVNRLSRSDVCKRKKAFAKNDILTVFCEISMIEEVGVMLYNHTERNLFKPFSELQSVEVQDQQLCYGSALSREFTWKIPKFFDLPKDEGFFIDSAEFPFANATWCLRIYPNGQKGDSKKEMHLLLVRLHSFNSQHRIHYRLGLKTQCDKKHGSLIHTVRANAVEMGTVKLLTRSHVCDRKKMFAPNGILSAFCQISMIEEVGVEVYNHIELFKPFSEFQSVDVTEKELCYNLAFSRKFTWKIFKFYDLPRDEGYFIDSTKFSFANATWCLRMYPNGQKGDSCGWILLFLVRLHSCHSEHQIHYELGLKTQHYKKQSSTHMVTFHKSAIEVGVLNLLRRSDVCNTRKVSAQSGIVTAFCQISMINEIRIELYNHRERELYKPLHESQPGKVSDHIQQLRLQPTLLKDYEWKITNFFELPMDKGYFIDSEQFSFANATWCMRMYPNGQKGDSSEWIHILLVRLLSCNSEHRIHYKLGLKKQHKDHGSLTHVVTFHANSIELGVLNLLKRSDVIYDRETFAQDGIVTAFCQLLMIEEVEDLSSNQTKQSEPPPEFQLVEISEHSLQSTLSSQETFTWKISNFFVLPMVEGYSIDSSEFSVANATWCLRMYPYGQKENFSGWIHLLLVRLHSCNSDHCIHYKLGLKTRYNKEYGSLTHKVIFHANAVEIGVVLLKRSEICRRRRMFAQNGSLTAFCQIYTIEGVGVTLSNQTEQFEPSSNGNPGVDIMVDSKENKNCASSLQELRSNTHEIGSKDGGNVTDEKVVETFDGLDIAFLKKKKRKKKISFDEFLLKYVEEENDRIKSGTGFSTDMACTMEPNINNPPSFKELEIVSQETLTKDEVNTTDGKYIDELDFTIWEKKKRKKKTLYELEPEFSYEEKNKTKISLCADMVANSELNKNNSCLLNEFKMITQETLTKDEVNVNVTDRKVHENDELDISLCKKNKRKKPLSLIIKERHIKKAKKAFELSMNAMVDVQQDENIVNSFEELGSNTQKIGSTDEVNVTAHEKDFDETVDELDFSLQTKEKMSKNQHELEYPIDEKNEGSKLETTVVKTSVPMNIGMLSQQSFLDAKDIVWVLLPSFAQPVTVGCWLDSPVFSFMNEYWCLRMYVKPDIGGPNQRIELYLVRLYICSLKYFIAYKLSMQNNLGKWRSMKKCHNGIIEGNVRKLGTSQLHFTSDGSVKIFCQLQMNEVTETSSLPAQPGSFIEFPPVNMEIRYGKLNEKSFLAVTEITWKIPDFFKLLKSADYYVNSPEFDFANETWCLQLYPNGCSKIPRQIIFILVRLFPSDLEYWIFCKVGIKKDNNSMSHKCRFEGVFKGDIVKSYPCQMTQSGFMQKPEVHVPNGILTVFFQIYVKESNRKSAIEASLPKKQPEPVTNFNLQTKEKVSKNQHDHSNQNPISEKNEGAKLETTLVKKPEPMNVGMLSQQSFLDAKDIEWESLPFFARPVAVGHWMDSPVFSLMNEYWCLRMYVDPVIGGTKQSVEFYLVRLYTCSLKYLIAYKLSVQYNCRTRREWKKCHNRIFEGNVMKLETAQLHFIPGDLVRIFFQLCVNEEVTETSLLPAQPESFIKFPPMNVIRNGVLNEKSFLADTEIAWKIPDFFELLKSAAYCVNSPEFHIANETWCLQLYPNGCTETPGQISFMLMRLFPSDLEYQISCRLKTNSNSKCHWFKSVFKGDIVKSCPCMMGQSSSMKKPEVYAPNGILTVFCQINVREGKKQSTIEAPLPEIQLEPVTSKAYKSRASLLEEELKSNSEKIGSKDDQNVITDVRIDETSDDLTILKQEKRMRNDQLEVEYPIEQKNDETILAVDKIHQDCMKELNPEKESDVTFFVRGEEFQAHSIVLKNQSTFFASMFQQEIVNSSGLIVIDNSDPNVFSIFLQYLYSGHIKNLTTENMFSLYTTAHKYGTQSLKTKCVQYVKNILSLDTVCDIIEFSIQQEEIELVDLATDFFAKNVTEIIATLKWQMFLKENYTAANELLVKVLKK